MKKIYNLHLATEAWVFWQGKKADNVVFFYYWRQDSHKLFVSDSWYCQIQTSRLIMFFDILFLIWIFSCIKKMFLYLLWPRLGTHKTKI